MVPSLQRPGERGQAAPIAPATKAGCASASCGRPSPPDLPWNRRSRKPGRRLAEGIPSQGQERRSPPLAHTVRRAARQRGGPRRWGYRGGDALSPAVVAPPLRRPSGGVLSAPPTLPLPAIGGSLADRPGIHPWLSPPSRRGPRGLHGLRRAFTDGWSHRSIPRALRGGKPKNGIQGPRLRRRTSPAARAPQGLSVRLLSPLEAFPCHRRDQGHAKSASQESSLVPQRERDHPPWIFDSAVERKSRGSSAGEGASRGRL